MLLYGLVESLVRRERASSKLRMRSIGQQSDPLVEWFVDKGRYFPRLASASVLDHLEVDLGDVCADHASCATVDDGIVALSLVLILYEPEWRVQIGRFLNSETGVELCYLVHFLFQEESLVLLHFIFRSKDSFIAV